MGVTEILGCDTLDPWIRNAYNVTMNNGTSADDLPGHLNLCFFDTTVSLASVLLVLIILGSTSHTFFFKAHYDHTKSMLKWSSNVAFYRRINLFLPFGLAVLSTIILFQDTSLNIRKRALYDEGYSSSTNRGILIGSATQCVSYVVVLVSVIIYSLDKKIWHVPRGLRWWILCWNLACLTRVQCTIEALAGYESATNWPFGEVDNLERHKVVQWLRVLRFAFLVIFSLAILVQRDVPSFEFDVSPSESQLKKIEEEEENDENEVETKMTSITKPLLDNDNMGAKENEDEEDDTVHVDPSWIENAPPGADRILRRQHSLDTRSEMHDRVNSKIQKSDEFGASIFQRLAFSWMNEQVRAGKIAALQTRQLHLLQGEDLPDANAQSILDTYRKTGGSETCDETFRNNASVAKTIFYVYKWPLFFAASLSTLKVAVTLAQPMILQEVIKSIDSPVDDDSDELKWIGFFWCTLYVVFMFLSTIITMQVNRTMGRVGAKIRGGFTALIYAKGLRLTSSARAAVGEGKIVSLMEVDCAKLEWGLWTCMNVYQLLLILVGAIVLLWILAGPSSLASLIVMVVLFVPSSWAIGNAIPHWPKTMALKDRRVRLLTELLQSMRLTKALGWEGAMMDRVQRHRKDEARERFVLVSWFSVLWSIGMSSPIFINLATLVWFILSTGKTLTAQLGAPLFQLTSIIQGPVNGLPTSLGVLIQVQVSLNRIDTFLKQPETRTGILKRDGNDVVDVERPAVVHKKNSTSNVMYGRSDEKDAIGKGKNDRYVAIQAKHVFADWGQTKDMDENIFEERKQDNKNIGKKGCCAHFFEVLRKSLCCCCSSSSKKKKTEEDDDIETKNNDDGGDVESKTDQDAKKKKKKKSNTTLQFSQLTVHHGDLFLVLGKVGSGKSTLLSTLLNEVGMRQGSHVRIAGKVAYCAQQPWIQNLNLRQNILFGLPYDAKRYAHAVTSASLWEDFMQLPDGDATEIGERGLTLSGGQKARVALARAVYADADIYLLDDVFSAVDAHVALELAKSCIIGALQKKTRVLVTHATGLLHRLAKDESSKNRCKIVIMENGKIKHVGTYDEIMAMGLDVTSISRSDLKREKSEDLEDVVVAPTLVTPSSSVSSKSSKPQNDKPKNSVITKKLVRDEDRAVGHVKLAVWKHFFVTFGFKYTVIFVISSILAQGRKDE